MPPCDICGKEVDYHIKHFCSEDNPHIHICDECVTEYNYDSCYITLPDSKDVVTAIIYGQPLQLNLPEGYKYIAVDGKKYDYLVYCYTEKPYWNSRSKMWVIDSGCAYSLGPYLEVFRTGLSQPPIKPSESLRELP